MTENEIAKIIVDVAYKIHVALGPGLLESVYESAMAHDLHKRGLGVMRQVSIPVNYDGIFLDEGFRADLIVNNLVIVELKSVEGVQQVYFKQLMTYLKLSNKRLGLLINFNVALIKNGITRIVNGLPE